MSGPEKAATVEDEPSDVAMPDAQGEQYAAEGVALAEEDELDAEDNEPEPQRVRILPGSTETAASFEFLDEGHTLGNALRYVVMKNPDVEFCAYAIPHPSEAKMNIRIQTYERPAVDALQKGLHDIQELCDIVADEFWVKNSNYAAEHGLSK